MPLSRAFYAGSCHARPNFGIHRPVLPDYEYHRQQYHEVPTAYSSCSSVLFIQEKGLSQKKLEELSGVRQPIIARMEKGSTSPHLETVLKELAPLGKTLAIVPLE
jgi:hypothetical protein